jgi:hypothetical protein
MVGVATFAMLIFCAIETFGRGLLDYAGFGGPVGLSLRTGPLDGGRSSPILSTSFLFFLFILFFLFFLFFLLVAPYPCCIGAACFRL